MQNYGIIPDGRRTPSHGSRQLDISADLGHEISAQGALGRALDKTIEDTWRRVATALAAPERDPALWTQHFYQAMTDFKFLPAGRVVAGAGSSRSVTLFNCFVMENDPRRYGRNLRPICAKLALTMQQGGGIGYDFSTLRPRGARSRGWAPTRLGR